MSAQVEFMQQIFPAYHFQFRLFQPPSLLSGLFNQPEREIKVGREKMSSMMIADSRINPITLIISFTI